MSHFDVSPAAAACAGASAALVDTVNKKEALAIASAMSEILRMICLLLCPWTCCGYLRRSYPPMQPKTTCPARKFHRSRRRRSRTIHRETPMPLDVLNDKQSDKERLNSLKQMLHEHSAPAADALI